MDLTQVQIKNLANALVTYLAAVGSELTDCIRRLDKTLNFPLTSTTLFRRELKDDGRAVWSFVALEADTSDRAYYLNHSATKPFIMEVENILHAGDNFTWVD